jgi:Flp pilus assembly protein TadD
VINANPPQPPSPFVVWATRIRACFKTQLTRCLLLAVLGFLVHIPGLKGEMLWDDDYLVRANPFIKSPILAGEVFRHDLFPEASSAHYRPVQNISYMADYLLWSNFYGFHVSSVLWHVAAGVLLYLLLCRLFDPLLVSFRTTASGTGVNRHLPIARWSAFFVAVLWIVHPVHSAAVDYVSGRADSLAVSFGSAAWLLFLLARTYRQPVIRFIGIGFSWAIGLLALCSRESGCLWPVLFLLYTFAFERPKKGWQKFATVAACLLMFSTYYGLRQLPVEKLSAGTPSDSPPVLRAVLMLRALGDYGRLMVFPYNLHMERTVYTPSDFGSEAGQSRAVEFEYLSIAGLLVAGTLVGLAFCRGHGRRLRIFGAAWFLLTYLPISNLIELNATVAEHWLYLPSVGFLTFLVGCGLDLPARWRHGAVGFACLAVVAFGARSIFRSSDWASKEAFARSTIRSGGLSIRIATLLGQVYANREDYTQAERILRKAVKICPDCPIPRNNLAHALMHLGKQSEAEALLAHSTKTAHDEMKDSPRTWIAALNLAHLRHTEKDDAGAIDILEKARQDYPGIWELISSESEYIRSANRVDSALMIVQPYAQKNWWHYDAWLAFGRLLAQEGENDAAVSALRHANWLDIHETAALNLMALVRMRQNRLEDACRAQRIAVSRQPDQPSQYLLLSDLLDKMGRPEEARAALAQVSRLRSLANSAKVAN